MVATFGWKVHGMVHGKRCIASLSTPVSIRKAKRKVFLVPGCRMWTLEYLATQKVTHIVLQPNMDCSSLLVTTHGLVKGLLNLTPPPSFAVVSTGLPCCRAWITKIHRAGD